jgi:hypothetical protein
MPIGDIFDTGRKPRTETLPFSPGETAVTQYQQQMLPQISDLLSQALSRTDPAAIPPRFPGGVAGPLGGTMGPPQRWAPPANIPLPTPSGTGYTRGPTGPAGVNLPIPPGAPMAPGAPSPGPPQPLIFDPAAKVDPIYAEMNRQDLSSAESTRTFNSPEFKKWQRTTGSSPMMGGHSNNQAYLLAAYNLSGGAQAWQLTPEELASKNLKREMIERDMRLGIGPIQGPPPGAPGPGMADAGVAPSPAAAGPIPPVPGVEGAPFLGRAPISGIATQPQELRDFAASMFPTAQFTTPEAAAAEAYQSVAGPLGRRFTEETAPQLQALMAGLGASRSGEGVGRLRELYRQQVSDPVAEKLAGVAQREREINLTQDLARRQAQAGLLTPQDQTVAALLGQTLAIQPPEQTTMGMPGEQMGMGTQLGMLAGYNALSGGVGGFINQLMGGAAGAGAGGGGGSGGVGTSALVGAALAKYIASLGGGDRGVDIAGQPTRDPVPTADYEPVSQLAGVGPTDYEIRPDRYGTGTANLPGNIATQIAGGDYFGPDLSSVMDWDTEDAGIDVDPYGQEDVDWSSWYDF